uniref:Insulin-like peptide transcript variant X13 n=2 Tax=Galleria mellonella TaxID=7137 RepID=A0AA50F4Z8_GALME|nr:insulin-like peptide transcript variant X13 [Galleria mellonella]
MGVLWVLLVSGNPFVVDDRGAERVAGVAVVFARRPSTVINESDSRAGNSVHKAGGLRAHSAASRHIAKVSRSSAPATSCSRRVSPSRIHGEQQAASTDRYKSVREKSMVINKTIQLAVLVTVLLWEFKTEAATTATKFCGRQLGEIMSRVCHAYNSPSWDVPTVVEQTGAVVRRKRQLGIADECCTIGCTWEQLSKYCSISAYSEAPLDELEAHMIADRSAEEEEQSRPDAPAVLSSDSVASGSASTALSARREHLVKNVARAAPVVGTVSPLLTWGRTLNTDLPAADGDRYAYIAVYT